MQQVCVRQATFNCCISLTYPACRWLPLNRYSNIMATLSLEQQIRQRIDLKTKPAGALGFLEALAFQVGMIQQTPHPALQQPHIIVFAGDHGIAKTNLVNPFPQEVTAQMVRNFLNGGAAINVFCRQNNIGLSIVNAGVAAEFPETPGLIQASAGLGTANYQDGPAMTADQLEFCIAKGRSIAGHQLDKGTNLIGFGEMGISNTSSSALITAAITGRPLHHCVGKGTGANAEMMMQKIRTLEQVYSFHQLQLYRQDPMALLQRVGGFEIAQMVGAYLEAANRQAVIVVDGFIASTALLVAQVIQPDIVKYCMAAHVSDEHCHRFLLEFLGLSPILQLGLRLGEGTGSALAMPVVQSAVAFLDQMASFESAGVSTKTA